VTVYDANGPSSGDPLLQIAQTTTYVNGRDYFTAYYDVKNITDRLDPSDSNYNSAIYFRAMYAADLYVGGNDQGTGVFTGAASRFIGGRNPTSGVLGGFRELTSYLDGSLIPPWTSFAEDYWNGNGIWSEVEGAADASQAFTDSISSTLWDNGAGVAWDARYTSPLAAGADQRFAIVNQTAVPITLNPPPYTPPTSHPNPGPRPHSNPCAPVRGGVGQRLLASLRCTAAETILEAKCAVGIITIIAPALKSLKAIKAAHTLAALRRLVPARLYPAAKWLYDLLHVKLVKSAPRGLRTTGDILAKIKDLVAVHGHAKDLMRILPTISKSMSSHDWNQIALDLADIAGLHSCVEALALASQ
jgi:hypothetical protein